MEDNKYNNFCIYKIQYKDDLTNLYIGSTTNFKRRMYQHKKNSNNFKKKTTLYKYIRSLGGSNNFIFEKVLEYPCKNRTEGLAKEKEYIELLDAKLNTIMLPNKKTT
jgi:hypothetical protein